MDLAPAADRLFHGTVYATGELDVFGDEHGVEIETVLRSEAGTRFTLPLDALEGTDLPSGIQFVSRDACRRRLKTESPSTSASIWTSTSPPTQSSRWFSMEKPANGSMAGPRAPFGLRSHRTCP